MPVHVIDDIGKRQILCMRAVLGIDDLYMVGMDLMVGMLKQIGKQRYAVHTSW